MNTPLSRVVIGSLLILAWPSAHAVDGQKIFTQGGHNPAAMALPGLPRTGWQRHRRRRLSAPGRPASELSEQTTGRFSQW